jgi:tRNA pseudouridine55 synthase
MTEPFSTMQCAGGPEAGSAIAPPVNPVGRWMAGGVLAVDKPEGPTSFAVVNRIKKRLCLKKAGHCGTLDPFATGLLLVCINQATRISDQLLDQDKVYRFGIRLGQETETLDKTGRITRTYDGIPPSERQLNAVLDSFRGVCLQKVPRYAAVRVEGRRLYELSRKGVEVDRPERQVCIRRLELLSYRWPDATLETWCSKGTYVRQLASDIGHLLGCGAYVSELRRLASGPFRIEQAVSFSEVESESEMNRWEQRLIPMNDALAHLPAVLVEDRTVLKRMQDGQISREWEAAHKERFSGYGKPVRLLDKDDRLVALWWPFPETPSQRRMRVF